MLDVSRLRKTTEIRFRESNKHGVSQWEKAASARESDWGTTAPTMDLNTTPINLHTCSHYTSLRDSRSLPHVKIHF